MSRSIVIIFFLSFFLSQNLAAQQVVSTSLNSIQINLSLNADSAWSWVNEPLWGQKSKDDAGNLYGWGPKYYVWEELSARQYRERGIEFFEKFPDDSRFKEWRDKTLASISPQYYKDPEAYGESYSSFLTRGTPYTAEFDVDAERLWEEKAMTLLKKYFDGNLVKEEDKKSLEGAVLGNKITFLNKMIYLGTGDIGKKLSENTPRMMQLLEEALNASDAGNAEYVLQVASNDPGLEKQVLSRIRENKDSAVRSVAFLHEEIYKRFQAKPLNLKVKNVAGGTIDFSRQRGKVLLVVNWNIGCHGCFAHMPAFERIYKQFQTEGFNLIGMCTVGYGWGGVKGRNPDETRELEKKKAIEIIGKYGLTYRNAELDYDPGDTSNSHFPETNLADRYLGDTGGGVLYLFDQQGKLVATNLATPLNGQWLEYNIRKLLSLPLDHTGK